MDVRGKTVVVTSILGWDDTSCVLCMELETSTQLGGVTCMIASLSANHNIFNP